MEQRKRQKRAACEAVAVVKAEVSHALYEELETLKGEKGMYRIARNWNMATRNINHVKLVKAVKTLYKTRKV